METCTSLQGQTKSLEAQKAGLQAEIALLRHQLDAKRDAKLGESSTSDGPVTQAVQDALNDATATTTTPAAASSAEVVSARCKLTAPGTAPGSRTCKNNSLCRDGITSGGGYMESLNKCVPWSFRETARQDGYMKCKGSSETELICEIMKVAKGHRTSKKTGQLLFKRYLNSHRDLR